MKKWVFRKNPQGLPPADWAEELNISPFLLNIIWNRGFTDKQNIDAYLAARLDKLTHPDLWPQIPQAARIIAEALLSGKKLAVWGDYDVDGITSTALVLDILEFHNFPPLYHLPDRRSEGYGLNIKAVEELARQGCEILLTVDCGITDVEPIQRANELGMQVVVSDHHLPPAELPSAQTFVNPRMAAGAWPCTHLAGVGVAFYLMAAVNRLLAPHTGKAYKMRQALDLVALGTLADVMQLEGENRILVRAGLEHLGRNDRPGICALKQVSGFDMSAHLTSEQAVFLLAPRINAAGRMGHPNLALDLLRAPDFIIARDLALKLNECNTRRKDVEAQMHVVARQQAHDLLSKNDSAGLVLAAPDWHPGIVGIVASRIVEEFHRPTIVLCEDNGAWKGSGRSVEGFDLYAGLKKCESHLLGFGGHRMAAGVKMEKTSLGKFRQAFNESILKQTNGKPFEELLFLDGELAFDKARNVQLIEELQLMQPFGPGNAEPVFASPPLCVTKRSPIGSRTDSVLLELTDPQTNISLCAKIWRRSAEFPANLQNQHIRVAYTPKIDMFRGIPEIEITIRDWYRT